MAETKTNSNADYPAYPSSTPTSQGVVYSFGITKRELFAAMAMQGIVMAQQQRTFAGNDHIDFAEQAVKQADALITALSTPKEN